MTVSETSAASRGLASRIPLSLNQQFLCAFDRGDAEGAFSDRHTLAFGWRLEGEIDVEKLQGALDDVVARHESLRTTIVRGESDGYQVVRAPSSPEFLVRDLSGVEPGSRDARAEKFLNELESGQYNVRRLPHLYAELGRFDDRDAVLVLVAHHTATDAWSMQLIIRDLAACYAVRRGHDRDLPTVAQYQEFALSQQTTPPAVTKAISYWRDKLAGAEILAIPTDRPVSADKPALYSVYRFMIEPEVTAATVKFAKMVRSSPFMVLLSAYAVLLNKMTGASDLVVPTFTSGRYEERFLDSVGPFFNFVALRMDIMGCVTFRDIVERARSTCFDAYANDIPFAHVVGAAAPTLPAAFGHADRAVVAFEVLQSPSTMERELIGDLRYSEMSRRLLSQAVASGIPNGALWAMDVTPAGEIVGSLKFDSNLFDEATMADLVSEFRRVLWAAVRAPDDHVNQI